MTEIVDLWPDTIKVEKMITPVIILRQQASLLGKKTKNIVQGEVREEEEIPGFNFSYVFYIVTPALGNYKYRLLRILYKILPLYPVIMDIEDEEIRKEILPKFKNEEKFFGTKLEAKELAKVNSEEEFKDALKAIFNSKKVLRVISVLLSQSDPSYDPSFKDEETKQ